MGEKITPFDLERMLFGDAPPGFVFEAFIRGLVLYLYMLFIVRMLGKRMAGELTVMEMVLVITLGGSVAVAIQVPEGGVLMGFVVLTCAFLFERGFAVMTIKSRKFEKLSQGQGVILIKDGVLQLETMKATNITQQQIFATLRVKQVHQLGEVQRLYLETGGTFSLFKAAGSGVPGLTIYPSDDGQLIERQETGDGLLACGHCGFVSRESGSGSACQQCNQDEWTHAIT